MLDHGPLSQAAVGTPEILATIEPLLAPLSQIEDPDLSYDGRPPVLLEGRAGDVALFVSDVWHRGTPADGDSGRLFPAGPLRPARHRAADPDGRRSEPMSPEAIACAVNRRERDLVGLHETYFYDG